MDTKTYLNYRPYIKTVEVRPTLKQSRNERSSYQRKTLKDLSADGHIRGAVKRHFQDNQYMGITQGLSAGKEWQKEKKINGKCITKTEHKLQQSHSH